MEWLHNVVDSGANIQYQRIRIARETSVDLGEGGKIVGAFLGAFFTVSNPTKNFKGKIGKLAMY